MKKSIFKITTLLLLLCAAMCSVVGIAACSSSDEEEAINPFIGYWVGTGERYGDEAAYYLNVKPMTLSTSSGDTKSKTAVWFSITVALKQEDGSYTTKTQDSVIVQRVSSGAYYSGSLILTLSSISYNCRIEEIPDYDDNEFTLKEYYHSGYYDTWYTYTFTRTTMTLDEWKALYS